MGSKNLSKLTYLRQPRQDAIFNTYLSVLLFFFSVVGKPLRCKEFRTTCHLSSLLWISIMYQMVTPPYIIYLVFKLRNTKIQKKIHINKYI